MKRIISLVLVVTVLVISLAVPSYAAEFDNISAINLLDYYTFSTYFTSAENTAITFDLPLTSLYYGVDIIVSSSHGFENVYFKRGGSLIPLQIEHIYGDLYRIYGFFEKLDSNQMTLVFDTTAAAYFSIQSFYVYYAPAQIFTAPILGVIKFRETTTYISLNRDNVYPSYFNFPGGFPSDCQVYFELEDWRKYDYWDFVFYIDTYALSSVSAYLDGIILPIDYSYFTSESGNFNTFYVSVRVDLRGLDRTISDIPQVMLTFDSKVDENINEIRLVSSIAGVLLDTIKPLPYFFTNLFSNLSNWFGNVNTWISNQTNSITSSISTWGQLIVNALDPNTSDTEEVIDQVNQQANDLEQGNEVLNNVPKPDLTGAGDISSIISPSNVASNTLFLTNLMSAPVLSDVLLLSLIFALAGFVLFGKR